MFRAMRRRKQALDERTCRQVLTEEKRGVFAVNGDEGYPYAVPVDFYFDEATESIYLHSAIAGHKVDAIAASDKVCFTTWNKGERPEDDWAYFVDSVIVFGRASIVEDEGERQRIMRMLGMKYYPSAEEVEHEIEKDMPRMLLIRIAIEHMTGKHVHER